jgi:hypothetical protein
MMATNTNTNKFLNCREWRTFLAALQGPSAHPSMISALRASQAWLGGSAAKTYGWLLVNGNLVAGARKTLGI